MKGVILQPNFIPWRGYFDLIQKADIFVFMDDVQYTSRDWRNRNKIKTSNGLKWLTVPIKQVQRDQLINSVEIDYSNNWQKKHFQAIKTSYSKAKYFNDFEDLLVSIYNQKTKYLVDLDINAIEWICRYLNFDTKFYRSSKFLFHGKKQERILEMCSYFNITHYITGPSAKSYINPEIFEKNKITLEFQEYQYCNYHQLFGPFEGGVSILDLLFNCGPRSIDYLK